MHIEFKTKTLEINLCTEHEMRKAYGDDRAKKIRIRMGMLAAANNLAEIPHRPSFRRHELKGSRAGQYGIDINENFRLILEPNHTPVPVKPDGGHDLNRITSVRILGVEDYH